MIAVLNHAVDDVEAQLALPRHRTTTRTQALTTTVKTTDGRTHDY